MRVPASWDADRIEQSIEQSRDCAWDTEEIQDTQTKPRMFFDRLSEEEIADEVVLDLTDQDEVKEALLAEAKEKLAEEIRRLKPYFTWEQLDEIFNLRIYHNKDGIHHQKGRTAQRLAGILATDIENPS